MTDLITHITAACLVVLIFLALIAFGIFLRRLFHHLKTDFGYGKNKEGQTEGATDTIPVDPYSEIIDHYPTCHRQDGVK